MSLKLSLRRTFQIGRSRTPDGAPVAHWIKLLAKGALRSCFIDLTFEIHCLLNSITMKFNSTTSIVDKAKRGGIDYSHRNNTAVSQSRHCPLVASGYPEASHAFPAPVGAVRRLPGYAKRRFRPIRAGTIGTGLSRSQDGALVRDQP
jgi:hypothetical protein